MNAIKAIRAKITVFSADSLAMPLCSPDTDEATKETMISAITIPRRNAPSNKPVMLDIPLDSTKAPVPNDDAMPATSANIEIESTIPPTLCEQRRPNNGCNEALIEKR